MEREHSLRSLRLWLPYVCMLFATIGPMAAQTGDSSYYQIQYVEVRPDQWNEYKAAVQDLVTVFEKHDRKFPMIARYHPNEMVVRFITPLSGLGDLENLEAENSRIWEAAGEVLGEISARYRKASIASRTEIFRHRPDLSYSPENPVPPPGDVQYHRIHYFYIERDQIGEAEANAREYADLLREHGARRPFDLFECIVGTDGLYLLAIPAANASELHTETAIDRKLTADLEKRSLEAARDLIVRESTNLPELTYVPGGE